MSKIRPIVAKTPESLAAALGLPRSMAREWQVQHSLVKRLRDVVAKERFTHAEIAKRAGSSRTRITAILNGNVEQVSSDLLIRILGALGYVVRVPVSRRPVKAA